MRGRELATHCLTLAAMCLGSTNVEIVFHAKPIPCAMAVEGSDGNEVDITHSTVAVFSDPENGSTVLKDDNPLPDLVSAMDTLVDIRRLRNRSPEGKKLRPSVMFYFEWGMGLMFVVEVR